MSVKLAIIIPVFKQPGLLAEALHSALAQQVSASFAIIIVNDGCPFPETHQVALEYTAAYPKQVFYVHKKNGGLSSARNAGIDYAMSAFPALEAVYFLDADNRLHPYVLDRSYQGLRTSDETVGWAYPDINKFGFEEFCDMSGNYSPLAHLAQNYCEAGSMVHRRVLDMGIRYDEDMKSGYEDWEFWLQCINAGFLGVHVPDIGFGYRHRAESMLKESERQHEAIMSYIKKKHSKLFSSQNFITLEHHYAPRYAIYMGQHDKWSFVTDPAYRKPEITFANLRDRFFRYMQQPQLGIVPDYFVFASEPFLTSLESHGLLHHVLWQMERGLDNKHFVFAELSYTNEAAYSVTFVPSQDASCFEGKSPLLMCNADMLAACVKDPQTSWISSLATDKPQPAIHISQWKISTKSRQHTVPAAAFMLIAFARLHEQFKQLPEHIKPEQSQHMRSQIKSARQLSQNVVGVDHILPLIPRPKKKVGIMLPVAMWGGVERVAFNYAQALKTFGCEPHLFIIGANKVQIPDHFSRLFATVNFFNDPQLGVYDWPPKEEYMGFVRSNWHKHGDASGALSLLATMQIVINCHCTEIFSLMPLLKRQGIRTYTALHLVDIHPMGHPQGVPHALLAYEHAFDGVLVISEQLRRWCMSHGVPDDKVIHVPNAASYPVPSSVIEQVLSEKLLRTNKQKLRLLFMGRFDHQKGLDRLLTLVEACKQQLPDVEWRIVGKTILDENASEVEALKQWILPPAITNDQLNEHYAWADGFVLLSRFEGVPLALLEAGRLGCVSLVTDVGAVREIIDDRNTGFLFNNALPNQELTAQAIHVIKELAGNRTLLKQMAMKASRRCQEQSWEKSVRILAQHMGLGEGLATHEAVRRNEAAAHAV